MANSNVNFVRRLTLPNYRVVFHESVSREYVVRDCRTPEEAELAATDLRDAELSDDPATIWTDIEDAEIEEIEEEA